MNQNNESVVGRKLLLRGIHVTLTEAMQAAIEEKVARLIRHEPYIDRVRIDVENDERRSGLPMFVAKGHIEISGPDIVASVSTEDAYKSIDLLISKLDRMLRKRTTARLSRRGSGTLAELAESA